MKRYARSLLAALFAGAAMGQAPQPPSPLLSNPAVNQLCQRSIQLMDAGGVAIPDLRRAAEPMIESARQTCRQLQIQPAGGQATYNLKANVGAFLDLADAVPKPFPFPDAARAQLAELRDTHARLDAHFRALLDAKDTQLRSPDRDNLNRYAEANRRLAPTDPAKPRVVFLGDSITDLWRLNEYFPDRDFVNRGISGQVTGEMLGRMKPDVLDLKPQAVLILGGTNDLGRGIPVSTIEGNLTMMAELAAAHGVKVILASVLPVSDYRKESNPAFDFVQSRPPTSMNYFDALVDSKGLLTEDESDDGLHPNAKGYRVMAPLVSEAIGRALAPSNAPAPAPAKPARRGIFGR
jgi:lysophospholipase L1-like esterase